MSNNENSGVNTGDNSSKFKKKGWLLWIFPLVFAACLFILIPMIQSKILKHSAGKPVYVLSQGYGKVENVFVKNGDFVEPGKELCSYMATEKDGKIPAMDSSEAAVEVTVKTIEGKPFDDVVELPGIISPNTEANISAQVSGKILEFTAKEGDTVKKGDILVKIDKRDYQIAFNRAESEYEFSKSEYARSEQLLKGNAVNLSSHESKKNDYLIKQASYENVKVNLERCDITAPFDGIVDKKFSEAGEIASPGMKLAKLVDISKVKVNIGIPEKDIAHVRELKTIKFIVPSLDDKEFSGEFKNIVFSMIDMAKVYPLIIEVNNADRRLLPGMITKARIVRATYDNAVLLPIFSVIPGDDEYYVFAYNNGKAEKRVLKIGSFQDKNVHIIDGLKPGERIIDKGHKLVADGSKVKVIN
ncbi:MAG TPA: efflux RND transporter periplasmic adaptor subunit [Candidatus Wallbacteria bacterium]|nr:MAG: Multidrug resistance protein MdtA precursor [bacterium ADurb.Bin243]HPG58808.1 efflux RND transporter periplasmic adaptor subunit [Candidatus Wallbacteria bacterium]